jgi:phosphatidylserine synthase
MGLVAFVGTVLGIVAFTGHVQYPWPVTAVRMAVNAVTTLIIAGKVVHYLFLIEPDNEDLGGVVALAFVSIVLIIALFVFQRMGVLSTLFLIAFCVMGYIDNMLPGKTLTQEQQKPITIEQKTEK